MNLQNFLVYGGLIGGWIFLTDTTLKLILGIVTWIAVRLIGKL